jgi:hypothetical protein
MRHLLAFVLIIALVGSAAAADLGSVQTTVKGNSHVGMNPGTPDDSRVGGNDIEDAVVIAGLPYTDTGNTVGMSDYYDVACPYTGSTSPDAWYAFTPASSMGISVDLFGSTYDTKVYVVDENGATVACNDDFYSDYVSKIEFAALNGGQLYYIVVDGYGGDAGDYAIEVLGADICLEACMGVPEGEGTLRPGYIDDFNGGCNTEGSTPFQALEGDEMGNLVFCGVSGWYDSSRDTDWFTIVIGDAGVVEWTLQATFATTGYLLAPQDCELVDAPQDMEATNCADGAMTLTGNPGDILWIWVGPSGFDGSGEYNYTCTFSGLAGGVVDTESMSFDSVKSLYR